MIIFAYEREFVSLKMTYRITTGMKRLLCITTLLGIAIMSCLGQSYYSAPVTTIKNMVDNHEYGSFRIKGIFLETIDEEKLLFTVEDQDYVIPIQLVKKDLGAVKRFRALNLKKGDKLVITGRLDEIWVHEESYKGLIDARILDDEDVISKNSDNNEDDSDSVPFQIVEVKPQFNGGDANEFSKWVNSHLEYPAKERCITGRVTLQFTIKADGRVTNVRVLRGLEESLDKEAVRVVSMSPKWSPGRIKGKAVDVTFTFPVIFQLR